MTDIPYLTAKGEDCGISLITADHECHKNYGNMKDDSLVNVYSLTKVVTSLILIKILQAENLSLDEPVGNIISNWTGKHKERVTIRHILEHTSGLPHFSLPITTSQHCDWEYATKILKEQDCLYIPGTAIAYQARTFGFLAGMLIKEISGVTLDAALQHYLNMEGAEFYFEVPGDKLGNVLDLYTSDEETNAHQNSEEKPCEGKYTKLVFANPQNDILAPNSLIWKKATLPSSGGFSNARSISRILYNNIIRDESTYHLFRKNISNVQHGMDHTLGFDLSWKLGFQVDSSIFGQNPNAKVGMRAVGGSICFADLDSKKVFCYVTNLMFPKVGLYPANDNRIYPIICKV